MSARTIAADFLALDAESLAPDQVEDVICELANMICGAALSRLESETSFRLGKPEILPGGAAPRTVHAARSVDLGHGTLTVLLELQASHAHR